MIARFAVLLVLIGFAGAASAQDGTGPSIVNRIAPDNVTVRAFNRTFAIKATHLFRV